MAGVIAYRAWILHDYALDYMRSAVMETWIHTDKVASPQKVFFILHLK